MQGPMLFSAFWVTNVCHGLAEERLSLGVISLLQQCKSHAPKWLSECGFSGAVRRNWHQEAGLLCSGRRNHCQNQGCPWLMQNNFLCTGGGSLSKGMISKSHTATFFVRAKKHGTRERDSNPEQLMFFIFFRLKPKKMQLIHRAQS